MRFLLQVFNLPYFVPHLRSSCMSLLGRSDPTPQALNERTEIIREMMLCELGDDGERKSNAVARRVRYATDVQGLWYARSPEVIHSAVMETLVWLRVPGDIVFAAGAVFLAWYAFNLLRRPGGARASVAGTATAKP